MALPRDPEPVSVPECNLCKQISGLKNVDPAVCWVEADHHGEEYGYCERHGKLSWEETTWIEL